MIFQSKKLNIMVGVLMLAMFFVPNFGYGAVLPVTSSNVVPSGCVDIDGDGCISDYLDCSYAIENAGCSVCPAGNCTSPAVPPGPSGPAAPAVPPPGPSGPAAWSGVNLTIQDVFDIITGIACWLMRVSTAIMVIFIILAGLRFMAARGDPTKWTSAKKNFNQVLIGALVILGAYVIIATIANIVGVSSFSFIPLVC